MNIKRQERKTNQGFALVELLVAIGIITILSVSLLFQQNKFDSSVQITNVAYEIATVIQQAQTYSRSALVGTGAGGDDVSYGVHFVRGSNEFIFYKNNDIAQGYSSSDEIIERYTISGNTSVSNICTSETSDCGRNSVSISFMRPNPEPAFSFSPSSGAAVARIIIENDGVERSIIVTQTGQIKTN